MIEIILHCDDCIMHNKEDLKVTIHDDMDFIKIRDDINLWINKHNVANRTFTIRKVIEEINIPF